MMLVAVIACGLPKIAVVAGIVFFWLIYLISCWYHNSSLSCWFSALADEVPTYQPEYRTMSFLIWVPHPLTVTFLDISSIFCRACKVCEVKLFSLLSVVILLTLTSC
jgi:hypothetical protein